jgi:hypothetical protein
LTESFWRRAPGRARFTSVHGTVIVSEGRAASSEWVTVTTSCSAATRAGASTAARRAGAMRGFIGGFGIAALASSATRRGVRRTWVGEKLGRGNEDASAGCAGVSGKNRGKQR